MITLSLGVMTILSALFFMQFHNALIERVLLQLSSVRQLKIFQIDIKIHERVLDFRKMVENELQGSISDSSDFVFFRSYDQLPDRIKGFKLPQIDFRDGMGVKMVDLTVFNEQHHITVGILQQVGDQVFVGVVEVPEIQKILLQRTGLGQTGESYLVGDDLLMRSKSRFFEAIPWEIQVKTEGVINALQGKHGEGIFPDYRNVEVFSSYGLISFYGMDWVILTEMDHKEALFPLEQLRTNLIFIFSIITAFIFVVSYLLASTFVSPVVDMEKKLISMSKGELDDIVTAGVRTDEIGRMFEALNRLVAALRDTIIFAGKIGSGDFDAEYKLLSETDKLGAALVKMKAQLKEFKANEQRLITENQRSILNGEEQERTRLSREMHDGLGPLLTTLRFDIQAAQLAHDTRQTLLQRLDETINEVRRMSNNLMPSVLTDFGAGEAIGNLVDQLRSNSPIDIQYKNDAQHRINLDDTVNITLYRIAQEAINNALKHSLAQKIKISLTGFEDHISLFVSDNGQGFNQNKHHLGNGVRNMKERVKIVNGTIEITSNKKGTTIEVEIPIK